MERALCGINIQSRYHMQDRWLPTLRALHNGPEGLEDYPLGNGPFLLVV